MGHVCKYVRIRIPYIIELGGISHEQLNCFRKENDFNLMIEMAAVQSESGIFNGLIGEDCPYISGNYSDCPWFEES